MYGNTWHSMDENSEGKRTSASKTGCHTRSIPPQMAKADKSKSSATACRVISAVHDQDAKKAPVGDFRSRGKPRMHAVKNHYTVATTILFMAAVLVNSRGSTEGYPKGRRGGERNEGQ